MADFRIYRMWRIALRCVLLAASAVVWRYLEAQSPPNLLVFGVNAMLTGHIVTELGYEIVATFFREED